MSAVGDGRAGGRPSDANVSCETGQRLPADVSVIWSVSPGTAGVGSCLPVVTCRDRPGLDVMLPYQWPRLARSRQAQAAAAPAVAVTFSVSGGVPLGRGFPSRPRPGDNPPPELRTVTLTVLASPRIFLTHVCYTIPWRAHLAYSVSSDVIAYTSPSAVCVLTRPLFRAAPNRTRAGH